MLDSHAEVELAPVIAHLKTKIAKYASVGHTTCKETAPLAQALQYLEAAQTQIKVSKEVLMTRPITYGHTGQDPTKCAMCLNPHFTGTAQRKVDAEGTVPMEAAKTEAPKNV